MSVPINPPRFQERMVAVNGIELNVATAGDGPPVLLLHGWPHTWRLWLPLLPLFARDRFVIAPDLRGLGGSTRAAGGYDLHTQADDLASLLDVLGVGPAFVVGIDLGAAVSFMLAMRYPAKVRRLSVMEGLIGDLPGAENFLRAGPPWWFGFHNVPGLAETVLQGHEAEYIDWFLRAGTTDGHGVGAEARDAFVVAYTGRDALRCGFEHYRSFSANAAQIRDAVAAHRLDVPTLAIAGGVVGEAIGRQLASATDDLSQVSISDCRHIIPLEQPKALYDALSVFDRMAT